MANDITWSCCVMKSGSINDQYYYMIVYVFVIGKVGDKW